ncbi:MAG: hypothetical protein ABSH16_02665 [Sedimentisphaerales bacterium]
MLRKAMILCVVCAAVGANSVLAADAGSCLSQGRAYMFEGSLSGLRLAYETFNSCINDPACTGCANDRELIFLHSLSRMIMWGVRDNGGNVDSAEEFAREFGITVTGDSYRQLDINLPAYPAPVYGNYVMPVQTPNVSDMKHQIFDELLPGFFDFAHNTAAPEVESVIAELDRITETPTNRFSIVFRPDETGLKSNLEVDYGDVLVLKAALHFLKSQLEMQTAYDIFTDANNMIIEKLCGGGLSIEDDLLGRYPNLLKVLPTPGHPANGGALLAQARQDLINGIDYYTSAVNYILSEDDPQNDDLLSIDSRLYDLKDKIDDKLAMIRKNLTAGTLITQAIDTTETYNIKDSNSIARGTMTLKYNALGGFESGTLNYRMPEDDWSATWDVESIETDNFDFMAELEMSNGYWGGGVLAGTITVDRSKISNATFEYWGDYEGQMKGVSANRSGITTDNVQNVDLNPIFGGTAAYPKPVNPRDILPEFDKWNMPKQGTFGAGLGNDATLGGIVPTFTQHSWQTNLNLQPSGLFYLEEVLYPWQKRNYDGDEFVGVWMPNQLVFNDPQGDTEKNSTAVHNVDIAGLYMGYDDDRLYGSIFIHNFRQYNYDEATYDLYLSYNRNNTDELRSIRLRIYNDGEWGYGELYYRYTEDAGYSYWENVDSFAVHVGPGGVDFSIPWEIMPDYLPGRFVTLNSHTGNYDSGIDDGERNRTDMQIGEVGSISGTVTCDMATYKGGPIIVQACTNSRDADGSVVASTVIDRPGHYELDNIGLGWFGMVRAVMPCYEFDASGIKSWNVVKVVNVFAGSEETANVDFALGSSVMPCAQAGEILKGMPVGGNLNVDNEAWYYIVAEANEVLSLEFTDIGFDTSVAIFDRCGGNELLNGYSWDNTRFNVQAGKAYYIRIRPDWEGGYYSFTVSHYGPAITNDRCDTALEIAADVNYAGTTEGALCDVKKYRGEDDKYDVWFKFTPTTNGVYEVNLVSDYSTVTVYQDCGGKAVLFTEVWPGRMAYLNAVAGTSYYIRVARLWGESGPYMLRVSYYGAPLTNDLCSNALTIAADAVTAGTTRGAFDNDVWYRFTPSVAGVYDINITGSYYGVSVLDDCDGNKAPMGAGWPYYFKAGAGKSYLIGVEGENDNGDFTIQLTAGVAGPANDDRQDAQVIGKMGTYAGTTVRATKDGKSCCGGSSVDVWYLFTPAHSGIFNVKFQTANFDATLGVLKPAYLGWLDEFDEAACLNSWDEEPAYFIAGAGMPCYIRVAGYWGETGTFTFDINEVYVRSFTSDLTGDNFVDLADLAWLCNYWLSNCPQPYWCDGADLNGDKHVEFGDFAILAGKWLQTGP